MLIFEEGEVEFLEETEIGSKASEQVVMRKMEYELELKRMELEEKQKDREIEGRQRNRELEVEERQKNREFEERQKDKELELRYKELEYNAASQSTFDVSKHIRFVPPFQEKEVDIYFLHFEKIAENLKWPKENWTLLRVF